MRPSPLEVLIPCINLFIELAVVIHIVCGSLVDGVIEGAFVVVVGCGGVGSHCAAALARSGVQRLRLIDFDQVTLSSLNRHAVATLADVGIPKVQCLRRRLLAIAPWVRFDLRLEKYWDEAADRLLEPWAEDGPGNGRKPDFVIDAIDNIDTKVSLLKYCHDHELRVISAMGAGCKSDPTRMMVGDISTTTDDGLSRATRRRLRSARDWFSPGKLFAGLLPSPQ